MYGTFFITVCISSLVWMCSSNN